ncbi:hypothetical protein BBK36DRAFT_1140123 [Trichoderma citrinoviride]|uniref:Uncharacterized protein n=1 Tax=Trichoderma citrinoviride TaxID=58853 RepID=A0A2T4BDR1_9HYPO|nr:hypothetical protein BBK36DRAFT_1140123 [Trichoderma citrinoviride]PTB67472.1 hypothetical protein BBK36DRAFT_1140123 [Trichoderma citrinoviride]
MLASPSTKHKKQAPGHRNHIRLDATRTAAGGQEKRRWRVATGPEWPCCYFELAARWPIPGAPLWPRGQSALCPTAGVYIRRISSGTKRGKFDGRCTGDARPTPLSHGLCQSRVVLEKLLVSVPIREPTRSTTPGYQMEAHVTKRGRRMKHKQLHGSSSGVLMGQLRRKMRADVPMAAVCQWHKTRVRLADLP